MTNQTNRNTKKSSLIGKRLLAFLLALAMIMQPTLSSVGTIVYAQETTEAGAAGSEPQGGAEAQQPAAEPSQPAVEPAQPAVEPSEPAPADDGSGQAASEDADAQNQPASDQPAADPDEKKDETKEDEEEKFPAQSFKGSVSGLVVNVSAPEGALPEETQMKVSEVNKDKVIQAVERDVNIDVEKVRAADITFYNKEGKEVEPKVPVAVSMTPSGMDAKAEKTVVHIDDNWKAEKVNSASVTQKGVAKFASDEFSIYAIVDEGTDARVLVRFVGLNGAEIDHMYIKKNDDKGVVLYDPGTGEIEDDVYFRGWATSENYTTETTPLTIENIRSSFGASYDWGSVVDADSTGGTVVTYYAMLFKDYKVTYFDENEISLGQEEVTFRADSISAEQSYKVNMGYTVQNEEFHFEGWNVKEGSSNIVGYTADKKYQNNDIITITGDVQFSVNAPRGHWFIFDENGKGATYNAPQFVYSADHPTRPNNENMKRKGYTFGGWFTDKNVADQTSGGTPYNFNQTLSDKTTVYARWIPDTTAPYTIIIWKQNLTGDGWDFEEAIHLTGSVNNTINTVRQQGSGNNAYVQIRQNNQWQSKQYEGFHLKEFDQNVTITPEGNTVLNVRYDRNQHTLTFQVEGDVYSPVTGMYFGTQYGLVNGEYVELEYHLWGNYWTYGNNITYNGTRYSRSTGWITIKEITKLYEQSISDQFPIVGTDGVTYTAARWKPQSSTPYNQVLSYIDIMPNADVTFHRDTEGPGSNFKNIYYYVEALPGETEQTVTYNGKRFVLYKHLECDYNWFTEAEDYIELSGFTKYGVEPATGAWGRGGASTVKCYYTRDLHTINFMDGKYVDGEGNAQQVSGMGQIGTESGIAFGADISSYNSYTPDTIPAGYVFDGWYIDSACTQEYTFDKMPEGGVTVYAKWHQKQYRVFLHVNYPEGATENIDWGTNQQFTFRVSEGGHVSEPTGKLKGYVFAGWYLDEACTQVFNGEAYTINESNVTADYNKTTDYTDTYDPNGNLIDPKSNSDVDRSWITKKLDVYGKWRSKLDGASGIVIEYNADGGTNAPRDAYTYVDGAEAPAGAACTPPAGSNKAFGYWEVQSWNGTEYVGTGTKVYPGGKFTVLANNAKIENIENPRPGGDTKKYTVQLKAIYIDSEEPEKTHISWFKNTGEAAYITSSPAVINRGVNIPAAPTRDGYEFIGWARVATSTSNDRATAKTEALTWETTSGNWTQELTESNLYLFYNKEGSGSYHLNSTTGTTVTQVAPDENLPYHAMFAVWRPKLQVRIVGNTDTEQYNGSEQSVTGYKVQYKKGKDAWSETAPQGVTVALAEDKTAEAKGTAVGTYPMGLTKESFVVTPNGYAFNAETDLTVTDGWLKITQKDLSIVVNDKTTIYSGSTQNGYTIGGPITGTESGTVSTDEYVVTGLPNGDVLTVFGYQVSTGINVDTYSNGSFDGATFKVMHGTEDVTDSYNIATTPGTLTITAREVTVSVADKSVEYNGSEQEGNTEYTFSNVVEGHTATITYTPSKGTLVNTYDNGAYTDNTFAVVDGSGNDVTDNYTLKTKTAGKLTITNRTTKYEITVKANSNTGNVYDGTEKSATGFETLEFTVEGNTYTVSGLTTSDPTSTDVVNVANAISGTAVVKDVNDNDVTAQFTVNTTDGTLEITPREVTVSVADKTVQYNGSEQEGNKDYSFSNLVSGHTATIGYTASKGTLVNTYDNGAYTDNTFAVVDGSGNDVTSNYTLGTQTKGKLIITDREEKYEITVVANSNTGNVYDGTEKSATGFETLTFTVEGNTYTVSGLTTSDPKSTNVVDVANAISGTAVVKDANDNDVTAQFTVKTKNGKLEITPREVSVSVEDRTTEYNGSEQKGNEQTSFTNVVSGQTATIGYTASKGTLVNTYDNGAYTDNTFKVIDGNGTDVTSNYTLTTKTPGKLTITDRKEKYEITVVANSSTGNVYDGTEKSATGFETLEFTVDGNTYTVSGLTTSDPTSTDVVNVANAISGTAVVKDANNNDVTAQFNVSTTDGILEITKREITVSVADKTVQYNGSEQYGITTLVFGNVVGSQTATITYTPSKGTLVDTYDNGSFGDDLKIMSGETDVTGNYTLTTKTPGKLTITDRKEKYEITVVANSSTGNTYDGTEKSATGFETLEFTVDGNTYTVSGLTTSDPTSTDVVNVANEITGTAVVKDANDNDVTAQFTVKTENGTLEIVPASVKLTSNSDTLTYDGEEHTVTGFTSSVESLTFEGVSASGGGKNAGTYDIEFSGVTVGETTDSTGNYVVSEIVTGSLTINRKVVTVTADDKTKVEGTVDPTLTATAEGLLGDDQVIFTITREPGTAPGTYSIVVTGESEQGNYTVTFVAGTFTITQADEEEDVPVVPPTPTPTPPRVTPTVTPTATVTTPVATPTLTPPEVIENDPTPQATIEDKAAPKAAPEEDYWALINLLCTIATCLISVLLLAFYFVKRKADEDEQKENSNSRASFMDDQEEAKRHNKLGMRLLGLIPAIGSVVAFILTEDMSAKMQMVDKWTLMMVIILAIEVALAAFSKKTTDDGEEEQGQPAKA